MTVESMNQRTMTVRVKRGDLITILLALNVVIAATKKDNIPNDQLMHAREVLAEQLSDFDVTLKRKEKIRNAKNETGNKDPENGKADQADPECPGV